MPSPMNPSWSDFLTAHGASFDRGVVSSFGEPAAELLAARDAAVVCDLSPLAVLRVEGPDAAAFLQGQFTSDVAALGVGAAQYSAWCSPKGRMLANFLVRRSADSTFELLLPGEHRRSCRQAHALCSCCAPASSSPTRAATAFVWASAAPAPGRRSTRRWAQRLPSATRPVGQQGRLDLSLVQPLHHRDHARRRRRTPACPRLLRRPWRFARQRLTVRAGVPVVTPLTADLFVPQAANWDALGRNQFSERLLCRPGDRRPDAIPGSLEGAALVAHSDGTPPAAGERLYSVAFGDQACGTVVNAAAAPDGGSDVLAVLQLAAAESGDVHLGTLGGMPLRLQALPYSTPAPAAPRDRIA